MEQEIIPVANIAFAVLEDGSTINNFVGKDGVSKHENMLNLFKGLEEFIKSANPQTFSMFAIVYMLCDTRLRMVIKDRVDKEMAEIKE